MIEPKDYLRNFTTEEIRSLGFNDKELRDLEKLSPCLGVLIENYHLRRNGNNNNNHLTISAYAFAKAIERDLTAVVKKTVDGVPVAYIDKDINDIVLNVSDLHHLVQMPAAQKNIDPPAYDRPLEVEILDEDYIVDDISVDSDIDEDIPESCGYPAAIHDMPVKSVGVQKRSYDLSRAGQRLVKRLEIYDIKAQNLGVIERLFNIYPEKKRDVILAQYGKGEDINEVLLKIDEEILEDIDLEFIVKHLDQGHIRILNILLLRGGYELNGKEKTLPGLFSVLSKVYLKPEDMTDLDTGDYLKNMGFDRIKPLALQSIYRCHPEGVDGDLIQFFEEKDDIMPIEEILKKLPPKNIHILHEIGKKGYELFKGGASGLMYVVDSLKKAFGTSEPEAKFRKIPVDSVGDHPPCKYYDSFL